MAEVEGDYAVPAERDVSVDEFAFRQMCKVRVSDTKAGKEAHHVLAVSNIYGYTFIGCDKGLKVIQTSALSRLDEDNDSSSIVDDVPCIQEVALPVMPCHVAISSDNLTLSVCYKQSTTIKANFFDIRSLARPNTDFEAFVSVELLEDSDTSLRDLRWNPDSADNAGIFAACFTDGSVSLWQVTTSVTMLCSCDAGVNAICWSPKGKQIVCGTLTGKLIQYDKLLIQKKEIEAPNIFDNDLNIQVVSVVWLSTYSFLAAYNAIESTEQPNLVEVNTTKNGPSTFVNLEDVCYGNGEERDPVYYFEYLAEWQLVVTAQSNAMECIPVGKGESGRWERWSLDDAGRVELPLQDSQDTYPVGTAVDLTSKIQIPIGDNQTMRPAPIYMVLSTEGILCPFYMVYRAEVKDIVNPAKTLKPDGERQSQDTASPGSSAGAAAKLPSIEQITPQSSGKGAGESLPISTPRGNLLAKFDSEATPKVTSSSSQTIVPSNPSDIKSSSIPSRPCQAVSSIGSPSDTRGSRLNCSAPAFGGVSSSVIGKPVTSDISPHSSKFRVAQTRSQTKTLYSFEQQRSSATPYKPQMSTDIHQSFMPKPNQPLASAGVTDSNSKTPVKPVSTVNDFTTSESSKGQQTQSKLPSSATSLESSSSAIIQDEGVSTLDPLSPEVISQQATLNIVIIGNEAHGKSTVVKAISGVQTVRFKNERERNITIKLGYANAKVFKCDNCPRPDCYRSAGSSKEDSFPCDRQGCSGRFRLLRHVSLVYCPSLDSLMAAMLHGALDADAAFLVIAANESFPQPQTSEYLAALEIMGLKHILILQNKIDLMKETQAKEQYKQILRYVQGTIAEGAPIVPISALLKYNIEVICEYIIKIIPIPICDFTSAPRLIVTRSFDMNKPGCEVDDLKGGVAGGSILRGVLRVGQEVEVRPGIVSKDQDGKLMCRPIFSKIDSLYAEQNDLQYAVPGGLIDVGTKIDPTLCRADRMVGQVLGSVGTLPDIYSELEISYFLLRRLLGVRTEGDKKTNQVQKLAKNEVLMVNIGSVSTGGRVSAVKADLAKIMLTNPVCTEIGEKIALSRRVEKHWRLIGWGQIRRGVTVKPTNPDDDDTEKN